jgi:hypothetical protein
MEVKQAQTGIHQRKIDRRTAKTDSLRTIGKRKVTVAPAPEII